MDMNILGTWLTPLLLLPGVGALILSTSIRFGQLHEEFHHLVAHEHESNDGLVSQLTARGELFRNALIGLYVSITVFTVSSLLGALSQLWSTKSFLVVAVLTGFGILALIYAAQALVRESLRSFHVIVHHRAEIERRRAEPDSRIG